MLGTIAGVEDNDGFAGKIETGPGPEGDAFRFDMNHGVPGGLAALGEFFGQALNQI